MTDKTFIRDFIHQIEVAGRQQGAKRITTVNVKLGSGCKIDANYLTFHFLLASQGTMAEGAQLNIHASPDGHDLILESLEVEK